MNPILAKKIAYITTHDSFLWWAILAISMLSLPTYVMVIAYNIPFEQQISEIIMLALGCTISIYLGVETYQMIESSRSELADMNSAYYEDEEYSGIENPVSLYDNYVKKIDAMNKNLYQHSDGSMSNVAYRRSSDGITDA